jgi:hypothetical protein
MVRISSFRISARSLKERIHVFVEGLFFAGMRTLTAKESPLIFLEYWVFSSVS